MADDALPEIDRFALYRLQRVVERVRGAYDRYEFHTVYHTLFNYCTLDLSAFYLDVLKDRLYTSPPDSPARRSAQTVMHAILDAMTRLMAPILPFTSEEIWSFMPAARDVADSVHLALLPEVDPRWLDTELAARWRRLLEVRGEVTKALEAARAEKRIGHPLDADVTLFADGELVGMLAPYADELNTLFIVSRVTLDEGAHTAGSFTSTAMPGLSIAVAPAVEAKCERCWVRDASVGESEAHPGLCHRCRTTVAVP